MRYRLEQIEIAPQIAKWLGISIIVGILAGTASAGFLASLEWATNWREIHLWIIALLPLGGLLVGWLYHRFGSSVVAGNNLIIDEIHDPRKVIPLRMTPLVLFGTVATHFFGGSAGREGTAVQMGGSLADQLTHVFKFKPEDRRIVLMAGMSAGFAAVFGTPLAGAIFGLEVLSIGKLRYDAIFPCLLAAIVGDRVVALWGVHHTHYGIPFIPEITLPGLAAAIFAGVTFGLVGMLFAKLTHGIGKRFQRHVSYAPLRPFIGGILVAAAVFAMGSTRYIGLGIPVILESFTATLPPWDFAAKLLFTAVTLGSGFKGGEVTPLFFIGATLGSALSWVLPLPTPLLAGMGFVAVFAGAANTPISSTLMAIELFGAPVGIFAGLACVVSYVFSGHAGIYHSQRIGQAKQRADEHHEGLRLSAVEKLREPERKPSDD
jgi:H+/Cl- antiporter ClcA